MLVIGTGFHRQLFGNEPTSLTDWGCLLRETAKQHTLNDIPEPSSNPTMVWEAMVMALSSNAPKPIAAHVAEVILRKSVSENLNNYQLPKKANQKQTSFIDRFPNLDAYVLNLNFDHLLDESIGASWDNYRNTTKLPHLSGIQKSYRSNLFQRGCWKTGNNIRFVWHPHGTIKNSETLRLGLRDYGQLPSAICQAFKTFKEWERSVCSRKNKEPMTEKQYLKTLGKLLELDKQNHTSLNMPNHDHWVTRFMLSDVTIIGSGLSEAEIGLHWLLCQRSRNFTRISEDSRPNTTFMDTASGDKLFCKHKSYPSWCAAWKTALNIP